MSCRKNIFHMIALDFLWITKHNNWNALTKTKTCSTFLRLSCPCPISEATFCGSHLRHIHHGFHHSLLLRGLRHSHLHHDHHSHPLGWRICVKREWNTAIFPSAWFLWRPLFHWLKCAWFPRSAITTKCLSMVIMSKFRFYLLHVLRSLLRGSVRSRPRDLHNHIRILSASVSFCLLWGDNTCVSMVHKQCHLQWRKAMQPQAGPAVYAKANFKPKFSLAVYSSLPCSLRENKPQML